MDIYYVCGSPGLGAAEYALGVVLGLLVDLALCTRHRWLAGRPAMRPILPIK